MLLTFSFSQIVEKLAEADIDKLKWILTPSFDTKLLLGESRLRGKQAAGQNSLVEIGPRLNFSTALSTNAVSICSNIGLGEKISRVEKSTLYLIELKVRRRMAFIDDVTRIDNCFDREP